MRTLSPSGASRLRLGLWTLCLAMLLVTAWVHDDAFISFRSVENLVEGRGMTWNPGERVQVFTHPLWFLLHVVLYWGTGELYFSTLVLSLVCSSLALWWVGFRLPAGAGLGAAGLAALLLSQGFVDYSTSGLENPLTHLLIAATALLGWRRGMGDPEEGAEERAALWMALLAGLAGLNRLDLLALFVPGVALFAARLDWRWRWRAVGLLAAPVATWLLVSLVYFGFPLPNTAAAKLGTGVSLAGRLLQSGYYFAHATLYDGFVILLGGALAWRNWRFGGRVGRAATLGVAAYLAYLVWVGGDYMSGRFLTAPYLLLVCAWMVTAKAAPARRWVHRWAVAAVAVIGLRLALFWSDLPPDLLGVSDERAYYYPDTALIHALANSPWPKQRWALEPGVDCVGDPCVRVLVSIGLHGYQSDPRVHIVDRVALADPVRARIPARLAGHLNVPGRPWWRQGHISRPIPAGYLETVATGENRVRHPDLARFTQAVRTVTRGPLWTRERWLEIWRLNTGAYPLPSTFEEDVVPELPAAPPANPSANAPSRGSARFEAESAGSPRPFG